MNATEDKEEELKIQCVLARNIPKFCAGTSSSRKWVTYYTLLLSLGKFRWMITRKIAQIYNLNDSLKVPAWISSHLPAKALEDGSPGKISIRKQNLSTYFKLLIKHPCAADPKFLVFITFEIQVLQYFFVTDCSSRVHLNGVYVYKEHEGKYTTYEKQDNPKCVLTTKFWMNNVGWYLIDDQEVVFKAARTDRDSEYPPAGIWEGTDPSQSWGCIQVIESLPTKVEIENLLRRKLYHLHKNNVINLDCKKLSPESETGHNDPCLDSVIPSDVLALNVDTMEVVQVLSTQLTISDILQQQRRWVQYDDLFSGGQAVSERESSLCLNTPVLPNDHFANPSEPTSNEGKTMNGNKSPKQNLRESLRKLNIKLPQTYIPQSVSTESEYSRSELESSVELLRSRRPAGEKCTHSDGSLSVKWFSYHVNETDDSQSITDSYSRDNTNSDNIRTQKSEESSKDFSLHIWNPRSTPKVPPSFTKNSKTPILRTVSSLPTYHPDHILCLSNTRIQTGEKIKSLHPNALGSPALIRLQPKGIYQLEPLTNSNTGREMREAKSFSQEPPQLLSSWLDDGYQAVSPMHI